LAIVGYAAVAAVLALGSRRRLGSSTIDGDSIAKIASGLRRAAPVVFLLSSIALLLFARRFALRYDQPLNPDEAQLAAAAMLTHHGWLNWNIADTTTSGPLNAAVLAWPYLFGGDITLFATRLVGVVCTFGSLAFICLALRRLSDDSTAIIATAPAFIFFSATTSHDFVHYSSEQLPVFLLALAFYLLVRSFEGDRIRYQVGAGLALGLVPFAKLQAAPIAALMGGFVVARVLRKGWHGGGWRPVVFRAAVVCGTALLPALVLLVPLAAAGEFDAFLNGYVLQRWLIISVHPWKNTLPGLIDGAPFFQAAVIAYAGMFAVTVAALAIFARRTGVRSAPSPDIVWASALALALPPVVVMCIIASRDSFTHYLLLAMPAIVIAVGTAFAAVAALIAWRVILTETAAFAIMLAVILPAAHREQASAIETTTSDALLHGRLFTATHNLDWLVPRENDRIVCWGWASQCYVDAAIPPATRDVTNEYQIYETTLRLYFRLRFLQDFARSRPDFFIDFSAPGNFASGMPWFDQDLSNFPELARIIQTDFARASHVEPLERCPRLYVRKARLAELDRRLIKFARLDASTSMPGHSVSALDDGSIFETCSDNWLLPTGALGAATIRFDRAEPIRSVAMLSTRDGADRVRLSIHLMGKTVATNDLTLARFPRWTWYRLDQSITADGFTIEILSSRGAQAGLNEVKAYRD
jgi:hypothetical protein